MAQFTVYEKTGAEHVNEIQLHGNGTIDKLVGCFKGFCKVSGSRVAVLLEREQGTAALPDMILILNNDELQELAKNTVRLNYEPDPMQVLLR